MMWMITEDIVKNREMCLPPNNLTRSQIVFMFTEAMVKNRTYVPLPDNPTSATNRPPGTDKLKSFNTIWKQNINIFSLSIYLPGTSI